ncbi:hypothetical protein TSOC_004606, partial [Tetrabaena socialis]
PTEAAATAAAAAAGAAAAAAGAVALAPGLVLPRVLLVVVVVVVVVMVVVVVVVTAAGLAELRTNKVGLLLMLPHVVGVMAVLRWMGLYEVAAGYINVLASRVDALDVFLAAATMRGLRGFKEWMAVPPNVRLLPLPKKSFPSRRVLIFLSPEYNAGYVEKTIKASQPDTVILLIHNGPSKAVERFLELPVRVLHFMTLAPHVAGYLGKRLNKTVHWALPVMPFKPPDPCAWGPGPLNPAGLNASSGQAASEVRQPNASAPLNISSCISGFAIQGQFEAHRRNYPLLWDEINRRGDELENPRFHVDILGSGDAKALKIPKEIDGLVRLHHGVSYPVYYNILHHTFALLPLLASSSYLQHKFTSTVISSFSSGVPMLVDPKFHGVYQYLHTDGFMQCFFQQLPGETLVDSMIRIMHSKDSYQQGVREALVLQRQKLNDHAGEVLLSLFPGGPGATGAAAQPPLSGILQGYFQAPSAGLTADELTSGDATLQGTDAELSTDVDPAVVSSQAIRAQPASVVLHTPLVAYTAAIICAMAVGVLVGRALAGGR